MDLDLDNSINTPSPVVQRLYNPLELERVRFERDARRLAEEMKG